MPIKIPASFLYSKLDSELGLYEVEGVNLDTAFKTLRSYGMTAKTGIPIVSSISCIDNSKLFACTLFKIKPFIGTFLCFTSFTIFKVEVKVGISGVATLRS